MCCLLSSCLTFYISDEVAVQFEGDDYPLREIASISKKDPKKVVIDASAFPQASVNIMKALRESGMNLNPQQVMMMIMMMMGMMIIIIFVQDGLTIFVPIPKVTKEFREKLAAGAKKRMNDCKVIIIIMMMMIIMNDCKEDLRKVQNRYIKQAWVNTLPGNPYFPNNLQIKVV